MNDEDDRVVTPQAAMVERFQCSGCVAGMNTECGKFKPDDSYGFTCQGHVLGTSIIGMGHIALGLPKGFNRSPPDASHPAGTANKMEIRFFVAGTKPTWNELNVPVWAMEQEGHLFVRTVSPRVARMRVEVIEGGTLAMVPGAIDVSKFYDKID